MRIGRFITLAVLSLPLALIAYMAVLVALSSPWDWSDRAVSPYRLTYWAASLSPFLISTPALVLACWGLVDLIHATRGKFHVSWFQLILAGLMVCAGGLILFGLSG